MTGSRAEIPTAIQNRCLIACLRMSLSWSMVALAFGFDGFLGPGTIRRALGFQSDLDPIPSDRIEVGSRSGGRLARSRGRRGGAGPRGGAGRRGAGRRGGAGRGDGGGSRGLGYLLRHLAREGL